MDFYVQQKVWYEEKIITLKIGKVFGLNLVSSVSSYLSALVNTENSTTYFRFQTNYKFDLAFQNISKCHERILLLMNCSVMWKVTKVG